MNISEQIDRFLQSESFGVVGASSNPDKYGNKVFRCYQQNNRKAFPVNPREKMIEGVECVSGVTDLPDDVKSISIITPPQVTEKIVSEAIGRGIENIWMQPGAESAKAVEDCRKNGVNVIADGSCILVVLGFRES